MFKCISLLIVLVIFFTETIISQTFVYDFTHDNNGWAGDFADYPVNDSIFYELSFSRCKLPAPLDTNKYSLRISGNNHSDDLFMFVKKKLSNLLPNTVYDIMMEINLASNYPTNAIGVGGSPGESVTIKAGSSLIEPKKIVQNDFFIMNIDKGNQIRPGSEMDTIGNVGVTDTTTVYALVDRNNETHLFRIMTDSKGEVWICIGTDSGFEATTTIYLNQITLIFTEITNISDDTNVINEYKLNQNYPNPFNPSTEIGFSIPTQNVVKLKLYNSLGQEITTLINEEMSAGNYNYQFYAGNYNLSSGIYYYQLSSGSFIQTNKMLLLK